MQTERLPANFFRAALTVLFLAVFYTTVTNTAGVYIASDLGGSHYTSVYPMVFFGLGNLLTIPITHNFSERFGAIKVLCISLALYTIASILCSTAPTFLLFNFYRLALGLASGPFYILFRMLLDRHGKPDQIEKYSFYSIVLFATVPTLGVVFGALLSYVSLWRWIFHFNNPASLLLAFYFWHFFKALDQEHPLKTLPFDWIGYLFFFVGATTLVTAATLSQELDWYRSTTLNTLTLIGIPSFLFFLLRSLEHPSPVLELRLLKHKMLSFSLINLFVLFSAYFGMIILITLWLNIYANYTPVWIAALIAIMGVAALGAFILSKDVLKKFDPRITLGIAIFSLAISCYYSTYFDVEVDLFHLTVARTLAGMGLILFLVPLFHLSFANCAKEKALPTLTLFQSVRVLGCALGAGLYVIVWQRRQAFFHERLGEQLTATSQLTAQYMERAVQIFSLTPSQAIAQLGVYQENQATSLALNDVFGCMGYILAGLFILLLSSFFITPYATPK